MPLSRRTPNLAFAEAYHAAQSFLVHIGAAPSRLEEPADGIVEFEGAGYFSRLRYDDAPIAQGAILALLRQVEDAGLTPILFSATGFTGSAEVFGENLNVALFSISSTGAMDPRSPAAHRLMPREPFRPPFAPDESEDADRPSGIWMPGQSGIADHEWLDCPECGTTHHPEANYCHRCGAALARRERLAPTERRSRPGAGSAAARTPVEAKRQQVSRRRPRDLPAMRCRVCGSTEIDVEER